MKHLALRGDRGSSSAREIAGQYDIPIELLAKVLQRLVRRGLLASHQGTRGGYQLARMPCADFGRRRHPGDRRSGVRHRLLGVRRWRVRAVCEVQRARSAVAACASGFWRRSASARSRSLRPIRRRRRADARGGAAHAPLR